MNINNIKITIDDDPAHEHNKSFRKVINKFLIPVLNSLPAGFFRKSGKRAETVHKHATTHKALEVIYNFDHKLRFDKGILDGFMAHFWLKTNNSKALRNRLKLVIKELEKAIQSFDKKDIKILNLACGSNRAVIEVAGKHKGRFNFEVFGVDKNDTAIEDAQKYCKIFDVENLVKWHKCTVSEFLATSEANFDIVEMVGFLDYVPDEKAINLFNKIFAALSKDGVFITGNIKDNKERRFVTEVVGWPHLIFRNESDLVDLILKSDFKNSEIEIIYEPQNIHGVIVARKNLKK